MKVNKSWAYQPKAKCFSSKGTFVTSAIAPTWSDWNSRQFQNKKARLNMKRDFGPATFDWTVRKALKAKFTDLNEKRKTTL